VIELFFLFISSEYLFIWEFCCIFAANYGDGMIKLILLAIVLFAFSILFCRRRWYAPSVLFCSVWLVALVAYACIDRGMHPMKPDIMAIISYWMLGFCVGSWVIQSVYIKPVFKDVQSSVTARDIYYYLTLFTLPVMIIEVIQVLMHSGGNPFSALRDANVAEIHGIRTTGFFVLFWLVSYIMELQVADRKNLGRVVLLFVINAFYAFISMGKMNIMVLFLSTAIILSQRNLVNIKHLALAAMCLLVLFVGIQKIRGSYANPKHFVALYMTSSLGNLNANVVANSAENPGENTFRLYYAIQSKIDGGKTQVIDPVLDFNTVRVGDLRMYSNTYTSIYPFYKDFGKVGVWVFSIFLGLLMGYLFKTAEDGSQFALVLYAILASTIVMQFIGDTFFMVLSQNLQYLIAALIPYIVSWKNKKTIAS
jgi:oligosaccharide repeat unit polymerase